jgi:hypothetical protein
VNENNRYAFASLLVIEFHSIVSRQMWHGITVQKAWARAERPASIVTTDPLV